MPLRTVVPRAACTAEAYGMRPQARVASEFEKTLEASEAFVRGVKEQRRRLPVNDVPLPRSVLPAT